MGKTFAASIVGAAYILCGHTDIIAFPTLTQSSRLLTRDTADHVNQFAEIVPGIRKKSDDKTEKRWIMPGVPTWKPQLLALSSNEISSSKPEGYTGDILFMDEGHRLSPDIAGIFSPFLNVARREQRARFVILGVGGHRSRLIEERKTHEGYHLIRYTADDIAALDASWVPVFDEERDNMPDWQWRQHYMCEPATEGMKPMYPEAIPKIDIKAMLQANVKPAYYFGIDVGRVSDLTVVHVLHAIGGLVNSVGQYEVPQNMPFPEQAELIYRYINNNYAWRAGRITIELNGMGIGLFDILNDDGYFLGLQGIWTDAQLKEDVWSDTLVAARKGVYGIAVAEYADHVAGLCYNTRETDGKIEIEHSDYWMAKVMAWAGMGEIRSI